MYAYVTIWYGVLVLEYKISLVIDHGVRYNCMIALWIMGNALIVSCYINVYRNALEIITSVCFHKSYKDYILLYILMKLSVVGAFSSSYIVVKTTCKSLQLNLIHDR